MDDILVYRKSLKDHLLHLEIVLKMLRENILWETNQTKIFRQEHRRSIASCFRIWSFGWSSKAASCLRIENMKKPKRRTITFGTDALLQKTYFSSLEICKTVERIDIELSFSMKSSGINRCWIVKALDKAPSLPMFEPRKETIVPSNAFLHSIGAVLEQERNSCCHSLAYAYRTPNNVRQKFAHKRELLAVVNKIRKWRKYQHGIKVMSYTGR